MGDLDNDDNDEKNDRGRFSDEKPQEIDTIEIYECEINKNPLAERNPRFQRPELSD